MFARRSYAAATTQELAAEAGIQKRMLFYYFANKDAVHERVLERLLAGIADFASEDLIVTLGNGDADVTSFRISAGSFKLKDKDGTLIEVTPPAPLGSSPSHAIGIKRSKDGRHALTLGSKGLNLDGLDVGTITSRIIFGFQTPHTTSAVTARGSKRIF